MALYDVRHGFKSKPQDFMPQIGERKQSTGMDVYNSLRKVAKRAESG